MTDSIGLITAIRVVMAFVFAIALAAPFFLGIADRGFDPVIVPAGVPVPPAQPAWRPAQSPDPSETPD